MSKRSPQEVAAEILKVKYPGAQAAFVAGSIVRGEETAYSDIDLVVIYPKIEKPYRESFFYSDWPVEAFVHDAETLNYFFTELDRLEGVPSLASMVLEGIPVPAASKLTGDLKSLADRVLDQGPPAWSAENIDQFRYAITDLIDDIRLPRSLSEAQATVGGLHELLATFYFRSQGKWSAHRKHVLRRLEKVDPDLHHSWTAAFQKAFRGEFEELISLAEKILLPHGGFFFDGYHREGKPEWRSPINPAYRSATSSKPIVLLKEEAVFEHMTLGSFQVRVVKESDVPQLKDLLNQAYSRLAKMGLNYSAAYQNEDLTLDGLRGEGTVIVVEQSGELVATMKLRDFNQVDEKKCLYLSRFAVLPSMQKVGMGAFLMQFAEKIAIREGFECLQLDTAQQALHLIDYYQSVGFQIVSSIYYEGKTYRSWILQKDLPR